jgi:hypothetical protein
VSLITLEGRRFKADLSPIASIEEFGRRVTDAISGSEKLRDAILLAKGIIPLPLKGKPLPLPRVRVEAQTPSLCPLCSAPFKPKRQLIAHIQTTVASYYGINPRRMLSADRTKEVSHPRQIAMYLARELSGKSFPDIGQRFNRDHTTVMHAIEAVEKRMYADAEVLLDVEILRERLAG